MFLYFLLLKIPAFAIEATPSASVIINKFQYYPPLDKNEWVEIYNSTSNEINLNNWYFVDEKNNTKILDGRMIGATSTLLFDGGKNWLNNDFDTVFLKIGDSIIDQVKYKITGKKVIINDIFISEENSELKGKWIGRSEVGSTLWKVYSDTEGPVNGGINYFNGYKTVVENIGITIIPATDQSGIGSTLILGTEGVLINGECLNFVNFAVGNSMSDGKCYRFQYVASDGVSNTSTFTSNSIVKFDTTKPVLNLNNAFRNILKLKSEFLGTDPESGILKYKYGLSNLSCGSTITPTDWSYIYNSILDIGYTGQPLALYGKAVNNALLESETDCIDFTIDVTAPKIINQTNPENGKYKIGDILKFSFEFDENIDITGNSFLVKLNTGNANFVDKVDNILNFEYVVKEGDWVNNLNIGQTLIDLNSGGIFDLSGNEADVKINNIDDGIIIDGVRPLISLIGESYVEVPQFETYLDLGATASDVPDGDLTNEIITENNVDTNLGGIYENRYSVEDNATNKSEIFRKIKVIDITAPIIKIISEVSKFEFNLESNETGSLEWQGKCEGEENNLVAGDNLIKIKNGGDGIYDDCEIRDWDKWGNVGVWEKIGSFVVDTTPPVINFINSSQTEIAIVANENLKSCVMEKENILSGNFETGNIDGWTGDWIADNLHFASGIWSAKSPNLINDDLVEKSLWQTVNLESDGVLSFWWRVSSEKDWDYLKLYIDGDLVNKISGEVGWQELKYNLNVGEHIIKFTYSKDYSGESGEDAGWIDAVLIDGGGSITTMNIVDNNASVKLNNLSGGSNKYKVSCTDMDDNKSETIEREIIINIEKVSEDNTPTPTPYTIFKTSAVIPTIKLAKPTGVKTVAKKSPAILGIATTPTSKTTIISPPTTKLKLNIPWSEIKFWSLGMTVLGITSVVILI